MGTIQRVVWVLRAVYHYGWQDVNRSAAIRGGYISEYMGKTFPFNPAKLVLFI